LSPAYDLPPAFDLPPAYDLPPALAGGRVYISNLALAKKAKPSTENKHHFRSKAHLEQHYFCLQLRACSDFAYWTTSGKFSFILRYFLSP
jgi:hypothetical protein